MVSTHPSAHPYNVINLVLEINNGVSLMGKKCIVKEQYYELVNSDILCITSNYQAVALDLIPLLIQADVTQKCIQNCA